MGDDATELGSAGGGPFGPAERPMSGYLTLPPGLAADEATGWLRRALDHVAALPVYIARRRMMKMEPPTLHLPEEALEDVRRLLLVMQRLDRGRMLCQLKGVKPGAEIEPTM